MSKKLRMFMILGLGVWVVGVWISGGMQSCMPTSVFYLNST